MNRIRSILYALLTGALLALSFPAIGGFPIFAFIALIPLLAVEDRLDRQKRRPIGFFPYSLIAFVSYNLFTTWWILYATVPGMIMAVTANGLLMALVFQAFHWSKRVLGAQRGYFALFFYWIGFEWVHYNWELSWPWLNLGNIFSNAVDWVQWYEYTGVLGGTLWILILNVLLYRILRHAYLLKGERKKLFLDLPLLLFFTLFPYLWSSSILAEMEERKKGDPVEVALIQPNIDPYEEKFRNGSDFIPYDEQMKRILRLARRGKKEAEPELYLAPETALPGGHWEGNLDSNQRVLALKEHLKGNPGSRFIIGLTSYKRFPEAQEPPSRVARPLRDGGYYESYNTALQIDHQGDMRIHHKAKLVLGVEKIPFSAWLPFLENLALELGGASGSLGSQDGPSVFPPTGPSQDRSRVVPLICYESIYGGFVADAVREKGGDLLAVITNDGWWSNTPGYKQHLALAKLRAIETRKEVARAANTGISAFIDRSGHITERSGWWEQDVLTGTVRRNDELTFYALQGDGIGRLLGFLALLMLPYTFMRQVKQRAEGR